MKALILLTLFTTSLAYGQTKSVEIDRTKYYSCEIDADCESGEECQYVESSDAIKSKICTYRGEGIEYEND